MTPEREPKARLNPGTLLSPVPAVLVTCRADGRRPNIISLAWVGTMCSEPPVVAIGVRPSRHSYALILKSGEFVVNMPSVDQAPLVDFCGTRSGREVDKFAALGLDVLPGAVVGAPLIADCPVNLECRVIKRTELGSHDVFFGEVVAAHAHPGALTPAGAIDPQKARLLAYAGGAYWSLGNPVPRRSGD
ncbi:MAG: flavin reductase family protein [Bacillota bacterium]|nr:flavin reductase family protein [Bacillota bacterium]